MRHLPQTFLDRPVTGVNLVTGSLADQIAGGPTLLTFLRHFG